MRKFPSSPVEVFLRENTVCVDDERKKYIVTLAEDLVYEPYNIKFKKEEEHTVDFQNLAKVACAWIGEHYSRFDINLMEYVRRHLSLNLRIG